MLRDYIALYTLLLGYMARSLAHSSTGMWDALSSSLRLRRGVNGFEPVPVSRQYTICPCLRLRLA